MIKNILAFLLLFVTSNSNASIVTLSFYGEGFSSTLEGVIEIDTQVFNDVDTYIGNSEYYVNYNSYERDYFNLKSLLLDGYSLDVVDERNLGSFGISDGTVLGSDTLNFYFSLGNNYFTLDLEGFNFFDSETNSFIEHAVEIDSNILGINSANYRLDSILTYDVDVKSVDIRVSNVPVPSALLLFLSGMLSFLGLKIKNRSSLKKGGI